MNKIVLMLFIFFAISCEDKKQNHSTEEINIGSVSIEENKSSQIVTDTVNKNCVKDFYGIFGESLIGMEETGLDTKKKSFEDFQVDKEAVCYGRTLLKMNISQTKISICSYYNANTYREYMILECKVLDNTLIIKTDSEEISLLTIEKLRDVPIFSLKYEGSIMELEPYIEIMVGNYIAKESDIEKFGGIPDCEDFEG